MPDYLEKFYPNLVILNEIYIDPTDNKNIFFVKIQEKLNVSAVNGSISLYSLSY
jgi:hypothetical protein